MMACSQTATAQALPGSDEAGAGAAANANSDSEVEALYDKDEATPAPKSTTATDNKGKKEAIPEAQSLSDLAKLAPFDDIAVIQRRFLPKTNRFEATAVAFTNLNNPFFSSYGLGLRMAYYLTEKYAIEGIADFAATAARQVTSDLAAPPNSISTTSVVTSKGFYGAALKWNPIYGKITWLNSSIVPFDLNFNVGGGMTQTTDGQSVATLHLGTSQVFAYTKAVAFRWDLTWNLYQPTATDQNGRTSKINQNDLFLGIGASVYFPEASYR